jgi:hypothetical protein
MENVNSLKSKRPATFQWFFFFPAPQPFFPTLTNKSIPLINSSKHASFNVQRNVLHKGAGLSGYGDKWPV